MELCGEKPNSDRSRHLWQIPVVRDVFWIALAATVLVVAHYLRDILIPILIALGLAYLFDPAIENAERRWRIPRLGTTLLLLVGLIIAAIILISLLGPILVSQVASLGKNLPAYIDRISKQYDVHLEELPGQITNATEALIKDRVSAIQALFSGTGRFFGVLGSVIGITPDGGELGATALEEIDSKDITYNKLVARKNDEPHRLALAHTDTPDEPRSELSNALMNMKTKMGGARSMGAERVSSISKF